MAEVLTLGALRELTADLPDYIPLWAVVRNAENPDEFDAPSPVYEATVNLTTPVVIEVYVEALA